MTGSVDLRRSRPCVGFASGMDLALAWDCVFLSSGYWRPVKGAVRGEGL